MRRGRLSSLRYFIKESEGYRKYRGNRKGIKMKTRKIILWVNWYDQIEETEKKKKRIKLRILH